MEKADRLTDIELTDVVGGSVPSQKKYEEVEQTVYKLWSKVPKPLLDTILAIYKKGGALAARSFGQSRFVGGLDWALPMLDLFV